MVDLRNKYSRYLTNSFVNHNKHIRWCPAPGCSYAIMEAVTECKSRVATCACGNRICWLCEREAHPPVACKMVQKWMKLTQRDMGALGFVVQNQMDRETLKWLHDNTKPCPFCTTPIQKNDGCFYMQCSNCHKSFCWLCSKPWETHSGHFSCSTFNVGEERLTDKPENLDEDSFNRQQQAVEEFEKLNPRKKKLIAEIFTVLS